MSGIGSLNEKHLHAALKEWYRRPGDEVEQPIDGFVADIVRDGSLIEIQTRNFSAMRRKFDHLLDDYVIRLVHPIAAQKWIVKLDDDGSEMPRKRSPKRGIAADVCTELVAFPSLLSHPNFTLEVAMVEEEEVRGPPVGRRAKYRKYGFAVEDRRLVDVLETVELDSPGRLVELLPEGLPDPFTTGDVAKGYGRTRRMAQAVAYCLRVSGAAKVVGKSGREILYSVSE